MKRHFVSRDSVVKIPAKKIPDGETRSFEVKVRGKIVQGIVYRKGSVFYVYQNFCMHLPITLDIGDSNFFNHDKTHLQCHMHGALYEPDTGLCTAGPCEGSRLKEIPYKMSDETLIIQVPDSFGE